LGKRVLVSGCGPIGNLCIAAARVHGAAEIVAVDVTEETLHVARVMGADVTINVATDRAWVQRYGPDGLTHERSAKRSFDVMLECSGNEQALRAGLEVMRPRGVVVQLGLGGDVSLPQNVVVAKELSICGSFRFHAEFALAVQLINSARVNLQPMVTRAFPLSQAREAFELAGDRTRAMKVLLDFLA
jgi:L-idonate 5-dehydrogenase